MKYQCKCIHKHLYQTKLFPLHRLEHWNFNWIIIFSLLYYWCVAELHQAQTKDNNSAYFTSMIITYSWSGSVFSPSQSLCIFICHASHLIYVPILISGHNSCKTRYKKWKPVMWQKFIKYMSKWEETWHLFSLLKKDKWWHFGPSENRLVNVKIVQHC